jgi:predicted phage-related endonuclease
MALFGKKKTLASYFTSQNIPPTDYPYYEIRHLTQGTDDWKQWRKLVIGASDAPTIMSENKFGSVQNLLDEKLGLKPTIVQDGKTPYLAASLDAIDEEHKVVMEIKCGARSYEIAQTSNPIPKYYYGQLQHILMITQLEEITYAAYRPNSKLITLKIKRDESYISRLRKMEEWFASELVSRGHQLQAEFVGTEISRLTGKA